MYISTTSYVNFDLINLFEACKLTRVGIPLYNAMVPDTKYGAYLKDPMPRRKGYADKIWITRGYHSTEL